MVLSYTNLTKNHIHKPQPTNYPDNKLNLPSNWAVNHMKFNIKKFKNHIILFVFSFIVFANTIGHDFVWDDKIVIQENPRVKKGISGIGDLFTKYKTDFQYDQYGYRPVTLSTLAIEYDLSGGSPHFSHFMNVFYYSVLAVLIYILLMALFPKYHPIYAMLITGLFIAHPLHVEVVANIKSRDEILGLLFSIVSLLTFVQYLRSGKITKLIITIVCFLMAYLSKENAIVMLGIYPTIFIIDYKLVTKKSILPLMLSMLLMAITGILIYRYASTSMAGMGESTGLGIYKENGILGNSLLYVDGLSNKLANAFNLLFKYVKNFMIPYPLIYFYGYNVVPVSSWSNPLVLISFLLHLTLFGIGVYKIKHYPAILFGFMFYVITISIYIHVVRPVADTMADRFMFAPSLGLIICLLGLLQWMFKVDFKQLQVAKLSLKDALKKSKVISVPIIITSLIFGGLTMKRNTVWADDMTLISHDLPNMENCSRAHFYYASLLKKEMFENPSKRLKNEPLMIKHYQRSIAISDSAYLSYLDLGTYLCSVGRFSEGIPVLEKATVLFPKAPDPSYFLGQSYVLQGRFKEAIPHLSKSIELAYKNPHNYYFLAVAYSKEKQFDQAIQTIDLGMKAFPAEKLMYTDGLAHIYYDKGDLEKSISYSLEMISLGKPAGEVYGKIISRCIEAGNMELANKYKEEAGKLGIVFQ